MNQDIRRELISKNLGVVPINHGQVYTFQIALPEAEKPDISLDRYQVIEQSLVQHQSNLVSLIIRRTDAYEDEDIEYEIVYGADWLQVAKDLNIERVWSWVFDMTHEQAQAAQAEMAQLSSSPLPAPQPAAPPSSVAQNPGQQSDRDLEAILDRKLRLVMDSTKLSLLASLDGFKNGVEEQLRNVHYRFDRLTDDLSALPNFLSQLEDLRQQLETVQFKPSNPPLTYTGVKVNLHQASDQEIKAALEQIRTQDKQINAALAAIAYWKQPGKVLSWENLERSAKAKQGSESKIINFGKGTLQRLRTVGQIADAISA